MAKRVMAYSESQFDQWRLTESGGYISMQKSKPVFVFPSTKEFNKYMELNKERSNKGAK